MKYSLIFLGFLLAGMFGLFSRVSAENAVLYFVPSSSTVVPGQTFRVTVMVDTKGENVNAVAAYFTYSVDKLDALSIDTTGSAMTLIAEPQPGKPVAVNGKVLISGGTPTPGFSGVQKIASVDFRVKPSVVESDILAFTSDAAVLRNSDNQNILSLGSSGKATLQISQTPVPTPPPPTPPPTPTPTPPPQPGPSPLPPPSSSESLTLAISDIRAEKLNEERVLLSWKTNEETMSSIHYGPTGQEDYAFSVWDSTFVKEHSFVLSDVRLPGDYSLEIIGVDKLGKQVKTERLALAEFLPKESPQKLSNLVPQKFQIGGFKISSPLLVVFVLLPILVVLLIAFLLFSRMRARTER